MRPVVKLSIGVVHIAFLLENRNMVSKSGTGIFKLKVYCFTRLVHTSISCVVRVPDDNDNLDKLSNYKHLNEN